MTVTFDPANKNAHITLSGANLVATTDTAAAHGRAYSTGAYKTTGKWHFEVTCDLVTAFSAAGISIASGPTTNGYLGSDTNGYGYNNGGDAYFNGVLQSHQGSFTTGSVVGVSFDADADTVKFSVNGVLQITLGGISGAWAPAISLYGSAAGAFTANFGATAWAYEPIAGYLGWDSLPLPVGNGEATLEELTASGSRIAAGAATLEEITAVGGYNGLGAATFEYLTMSGTGGNPSGAATFEVFTASGTGRQENLGAATFEALTASATGHDSAVITIAGSAPVPTLSADGFAGEVITFAGTAPAPTLEIGTKDFRGTAPVPTLVATIATGTVITVDVDAPVPTLAAVTDNPAIITVSGSARVPILVATLAAGRIITFTGSARAPILSASVLTGNVATVAIEAVAPILSAAGYPAFTITFTGTAPVPYMASVLSGPASSNYRTWVLNTRKGALTSYDNFEFNSYALFNGYVIAAGSSGIVTLGTQDLDNATAIAAQIRTGISDFGTSLHKRVPRIYVGHNSAGDMHLKTITKEGGERTYRLSWNNATGLRQSRVGVGKGPRSRYWQFDVSNVDGCNFDLSSLLVYPTKLRRRVM